MAYTIYCVMTIAPLLTTLLEYLSRNQFPNIQQGYDLLSTPAGFDEAFHSTTKVEGHTHDFYKYPARFSPGFARFILDSLTEPGDYVLDPFMGGGTTIVEAVVSGRNVIGSDVNELARFITEVKTTPLSQKDIAEVWDWVQDVQSTMTKAEVITQPNESPVRNMPVETYSFFEAANGLVGKLGFPRRRRFARCALVRVGQWALDARSDIPDTKMLCNELVSRVERMLHGLDEFVSEAKAGNVSKNKITATRQLLSYSAADTLLAKTLQQRDIQPKLVLTSPPYPGVHVLYHRWQVLSRRETPAPYWIANIQDGHGASYYTMGSRSELGMSNYFAGISATFKNLRQIVAPDAKVIQLMSFSDAAAQLPRYLDAMAAAGFEETNDGRIESRQIRSVPNRKWYSHRMPNNDASKEMMLVHQPVKR